MKTFYLTDSGKVRDHNEDNLVILSNDSGEYLLAVADGMGGHKAGEVASSIAIEYLKEKFNGIDNFKHIILHKVCFGDKSDNIEGVFKGKRRKAIVDKIKTCSKFSQFLESEFFDSEELKEQAKDLYSIIRLKRKLGF